MTDRVDLLRQSIEAIVRRKHPGRLLEGDEAFAFLTPDGICHGRFSPFSGTVLGFTSAGAAAIATLAADLRKENAAYTRGVSLPAFSAGGS